MELLQPLVDAVNGIVALLNQILTAIEQLFAPITSVSERVENLGGSDAAAGE